jgi:hypothetical protein
LKQQPDLVVTDCRTEMVKPFLFLKAHTTLMPVIEVAKWMERRGWFGKSK